MARSIRTEWRRGGLKSKACKLLAVCVGGVLVLRSGQVGAHESQEGLLRRTLQDEKGSQTLLNAAACKLDESVGPPKPIELTLSTDQLTASLVCSGSNVAAVPENLEKVCQEQPSGKIQESKDECRVGPSSMGRPVPLAEILAPDSRASWNKINTAEEQQNETWTLKLQKENLPLRDKTFYVGCQKKNGDNNSMCKLPIHILARASSAENNVVTCAYGAQSNEAPVKVEMTQEQNSLTLLCGKEGSIEPSEYTTKYCETDGLKECTKPYSEILPKFSEAWWTTVEGKDNSAKLAIPSTDFPTEDKSFYLGCTPAETNNAESQEELGVAAAAEASGAKKTTCKVLVSVKAPGSSLSSGPGVGMAAAASGAAVLTGLIAGAF
ncbi:SAG-related sequence [Besnoitia besnoiti]|uniref:SAG-related sequence n=1 Tax=Besnoitia besnoiti TaxID=94643 RepID=A0A2A9MEJ4_BESBE|nr:SAG-related sequence [Besnoitia besnoiti]PFH35624.1 SAG-related sequence [Besnoitia besnoiti]